MTKLNIKKVSLALLVLATFNIASEAQAMVGAPSRCECVANRDGERVVLGRAVISGSNYQEQLRAVAAFKVRCEQELKGRSYCRTPR